MAQTQVKIYTSTKQYQKDAEKLSKKGWQVVSVVEREQKRGCLGRLFFLTHKPKVELVVTYQQND